MSGHSKWSTIKRQKGINDASRGRLFSKLARAITIAVKTGSGPTTESNFKLRIAIAKAHAANMPKDNIERAIIRGSESSQLEEITYEGFGPSAIATIVEVATDNRNRTASEIKNIFERAGGRLSGPGSVSFNFEPKGSLVITKDKDSESQMLKLIDLGIDEMEEAEDAIEVFVASDKLNSFRSLIEGAGFEVKSYELIKLPKNYVSIKSPEEAKKVLTFLDTLNDQDDVQRVFANVDIEAQLAK